MEIGMYFRSTTILTPGLHLGVGNHKSEYFPKNRKNEIMAKHGHL